MIYSKDGILDNNFKPIDHETVKKIENQARLKNEENYEQFYKPVDNIWLRALPDKYFRLLRKMNESNLSITKWVKKTGTTMLVMVIFMIALGALVNKLFYLAVIAFPIYMYYSKLKFIKTSYAQWQFERRVNFSKFVRLIIPYLKETEHHTSLNHILNRVSPRVDSEQDRALLDTLRQDIITYPGQIEPFLAYANKAAGTNQATLFMSTLFDIQQGASDMRVVDELGKDSAEQLLKSIDEIIKVKIHKFAFFSTKLTMLNMILIIGFAVSYLLYSIQAIHM